MTDSQSVWSFHILLLHRLGRQVLLTCLYSLRNSVNAFFCKSKSVNHESLTCSVFLCVSMSMLFAAIISSARSTRCICNSLKCIVLFKPYLLKPFYILHLLQECIFPKARSLFFLLIEILRHKQCSDRLSVKYIVK